MNEFDLLDELTSIDDDLILEAHETPVRRPLRFRGLRKAAILAAAVMVLVVSAVAGDWNFNAARIARTYATEPDTGHIWVEDGVWYRVDNNSIYPNGQKDHYVLSEVFTPDELQYYVVCEGHSIKVTLEAMILFGDDRVEYKQVSSTQTDQVSLMMDNYVNGEAGTIIHVRSSLEIKVKDEWKEYHGGHCYLPTQIGFKVPYGIDARFPDMQYNYDGRGE